MKWVNDIIKDISRNHLKGGKTIQVGLLEYDRLRLTFDIGEKMVALATRIHPLVRLRMTPKYEDGPDVRPGDFFRLPIYQDHEAFNSSQGKVLAYMLFEPYYSPDIAYGSFLDADVFGYIRAGELEKICDIKADHENVGISYHAIKFCPTMREVLCAIPDELLEATDAFEIHADGASYEEREDGGCTSTVTLYKAIGGVPERIQQPHEIKVMDYKCRMDYHPETGRPFIEAVDGVSGAVIEGKWVPDHRVGESR